jgi:hypothetical protein
LTGHAVLCHPSQGCRGFLLYGLEVWQFNTLFIGRKAVEMIAFYRLVRDLPLRRIAASASSWSTARAY